MCSSQQGASQQPATKGKAEQQTQRQSGYGRADRRTAEWQGEDYVLPDSGDDPLASREIEEYSGALNGDTPFTGLKCWCDDKRCKSYTARCHCCQACLVCDGVDGKTYKDRDGNIKEVVTCKSCDHRRHTNHQPMD